MGALCLSSWQHDSSGPCEATGSPPTRTAQGPPLIPSSTLCPNRTDESGIFRHSPIRLSLIISIEDYLWWIVMSPLVVFNVIVAPEGLPIFPLA